MTVLQRFIPFNNLIKQGVSRLSLLYKKHSKARLTPSERFFCLYFRESMSGADGQRVRGRVGEGEGERGEEKGRERE